MNLYSESSAVLAWLLDAAAGSEVRKLLGDADLVITSDLTLIDCDRVLVRVATLNELREVDAVDRRVHLAKAAAHWHTLRVSLEIVPIERDSRFLERPCARSLRFIWRQPLRPGPRYRTWCC